MAGTLRIQKLSITEMDVDCIVNAANSQLRHGGGVCGAIFAAAGASQLQAACDVLGHCTTGEAVITPGFKLKAKYIVHAVGPIWQGGSHGEAAALAVALSLDSLTVGIGAGLGQTPVGEAVLLSFLMGVGAILLGRWLGDRMTKGIRMDLSWVSGAMLLVLAGAKLM